MRVGRSGDADILASAGVTISMPAGRSPSCQSSGSAMTTSRASG